jgi:hypothetical protein
MRWPGGASQRLLLDQSFCFVLETPSSTALDNITTLILYWYTPLPKTIRGDAALADRARTVMLCETVDMADPRYFVKAVAQAVQVMSAFRSPAETLRLSEVAARTGLSRGSAFRLLYTLRECGLVEKTADNA